MIRNRQFRGALARTLLVLLVALWSAAPFARQVGEGTAQRESEKRVLGTLSFPTTADSAQAQDAFIQGMLLLHLFEYSFAREQFLRAQALEPGFAMAVWGEAMTYNHPIWDEQDREAARRALRKLGDTPAERQESTPAARERLLLDALETLYGDGPKAERDRAYMRKMERLAGRFPEDHELQLLYALSIFGVHAGVRDIDSYMLATAIAEAVFADNPQHPGAAHYLIHGVDDPVHAVLGLRAARALAEIAPDAAHAQHMTSHIFLALGMWDDVVAANEAAVRVKNEMRAQRGKQSSATGHYNFWLLYGLLQQGRHDQARELLEAARAEAEAAGTPPADRMELDPDRSVVGSTVQMWLRYLIESGDWNGEIAEWTFRLGDAFDPNLNYNFALALRSAHASLPSRAREQLAQFNRLGEELAALVRRQEEPAPTDLLYLERLEVMEAQLRAMIEAAKGEYDAAIAHAREASRMEGALPRAFGPPFIDLPSAQLLGDLHFAADEYAEAASAYGIELDRNRQRTAALMGLVKANEMLGRPAEANYYRQKLVSIWHLADREVRDGL